MEQTIFCENLKKFRLTKKYTQEQVANNLNVNVQTVSRWECGTTLPDVLTLPVLARLYGVTVDDFYKKSAVAYNNYAQRLAAVMKRHGNRKILYIVFWSIKSLSMAVYFPWKINGIMQSFISGCLNIVKIRRTSIFHLNEYRNKGMQSIHALPVWFRGAFSCHAQKICRCVGNAVLKNRRLEPPSFSVAVT